MLCRRKGVEMEKEPVVSHWAYQQEQFDKLAEGVRASLDLAAVYGMMGLTGGKR